MNNELNNSDGGAEMYDLISEWCKAYFLDDNTRINLDREFESSEFVDWVEVKESCS